MLRASRWGGTRTTFVSALDDRLQATVISGYLNTFKVYALDPGVSAAPIRAGAAALGGATRRDGLDCPAPTADRGWYSG